MPSTSTAGSALDVDPELLERAQLALQSLKFEEQAARYRAAYSALLEAIAQAQSGNDAALRRWLDGRAQHLQSEEMSQSDGTHPAADSAIHSQNSHPFPKPIAWVPADQVPTVSVHESPSHESPSHASVWDGMHRSALERAEYWVESLVATEPRVLLDESVQAQIAHGLMSGPSLKRKAWWSAPHVYVSLIAHAILVICFSLWIIAAVQKPVAMSIVASEVESEDVLFETPMETPTPLDEPTEAPAAIPTSESVELPLDVPSIATIDVGLGPAISEIATSSRASDAMASANAGTKMLDGAEFFGSKAVGNTFIYVVDCSPSMLRDGAFDAAKSEILKSLSQFKPKQRFFIAFFGKEIEPMRFRGGEVERYALFATPENLEKTVEWISRVGIQKDGRPPIEALEEVLGMQPDGVFLLFDGDTKVDQWTKKIRDLNRDKGFLAEDSPKVPIHVVHFFRDEFEKEMRTLAMENGGTYRFIPRPQKIKRGKP